MRGDADQASAAPLPGNQRRHRRAVPMVGGVEVLAAISATAGRVPARQVVAPRKSGTLACTPLSSTPTVTPVPSVSGHTFCWTAQFANHHSSARGCGAGTCPEGFAARPVACPAPAAAVSRAPRQAAQAVRPDPVSGATGTARHARYQRNTESAASWRATPRDTTGRDTANWGAAAGRRHITGERSGRRRLVPHWPSGPLTMLAIARRAGAGIRARRTGA